MPDLLDDTGTLEGFPNPPATESARQTEPPPSAPHTAERPPYVITTDGIFDGPRAVGFARVVSDRATFAYVHRPDIYR